MPSSNERILSALAHISALAMGMGLALPVAFWHENRGKSNYVAFHSLQALGYQSLGYTLWMLAYIVLVLLWLGFFAILMAVTGSSSPPDALFVLWAITFFGVVLGALAFFLALPVIAAIACLFGKDFCYPFMGRLARFVEYASGSDAPLNEEHAERWVAAMGHFSVILMLWGMLAPAASLLMEKRRSTFLRFQSIQTLVYQGLGTLAYFGVMVLYFVVVFGMIGLSVPYGGPDNLPAPAILTGVVVIFCVVGLLFLLGPAYHILGQWAGLRVLQGHDYRYPLIGGWVAQWLARQAPGRPAPLAENTHSVE